MAYDIYGNNLRRGYCEVHPHVHEEYPCSVCLSESRREKEDKKSYEQEMAKQYNNDMIEQVNASLLSERDELKEKLDEQFLLLQKTLNDKLDLHTMATRAESENAELKKEVERLKAQKVSCRNILMSIVPRNCEHTDLSDCLVALGYNQNGF